MTADSSLPNGSDSPSFEVAATQKEDDEVFSETPGSTSTTIFPTLIPQTKTSHTTHFTMKPPPSSPTSIPPVSSDGALPSRGRRWSLDVISPLRLLNTHSSTSSPSATSTGRRPSTPDSTSESGTSSPTLAATAPAALMNLGARRYSQPIILPKVKKVKDKDQKVKAAKKAGKGGHHKVKESYLMIMLDTGQTIVLTCRDEDRHFKQLLSVVMTDRRVLSYRMIVASSRNVLKGAHHAPMSAVSGRKVRSCENLLGVLSEPDDEWEREEALRVMPDIMTYCRRREILMEMVKTDRAYYENLQAVFDAYAEPLRKFSSLTAEEHRVLFMSVEPILSLTASLVNKLEAALSSWDSGNTRLGNLFSNTFWSYYRDYYNGYCQIKSLLLSKQREDTSFEEFCGLRRRQGKLSLDALLALPLICVRVRSKLDLLIFSCQEKLMVFTK